MKERIIYGAIYVVILLGMTMFSAITFDLLYMIFMLIGLYEFHHMCRSGLITIFYSLMISLYGATYFFIPSVFDFSTLLLLIFVGFLIALIKYKVKAPKVIAMYLVSIVYIALPFLLTIEIGHKYGSEYIVGVFVLIWFNDSFAYLTGKFFGKRKLFPTISPNKTIEGLIGGIAISILFGYSVFWMTDRFEPIWLSIIGVVAITSNLGDLIQSSFKRNFNIKDTGSLIPGHGGLLDRLDSYIYTVPFIYFLLNQ